MDSFGEVFESAQEYCRDKLSEVAYNLWIKDIRPVSFDGVTARLSLPSAFKKNTVETRYAKLLKEALAAVLGFDAELAFLVVAPDEPAQEELPPAESAADGSPGAMDYTFQNFIVGPSNKFAHAASLAVAANPAKAYNPLLIHGGSGLGKTHLLCAICDEIQKNHPEYNILYVKSEDFTNELIESIKNKNETNAAFHDKYRQLDVLAMDDVQFIAGKESTQEEFFHTFNTLYLAGRQILLTSDRPPKEIKTLDDRLRTRFESGLIADVQPPDFETRVAILRAKAESLSITLPDDVTEYIAFRIKNNIRQLEGVVMKMHAYQQLTGTGPSILIAQSAIKDIFTEQQPVPMTVERIISETARTFGVLPEDIRSVKRTGNVSSARQVSMYIIREITQMSTADIGKEFSSRDHSTVVYATQQVEQKMKHNFHFREIVEDIIKNIKTAQ